MSNNRYIYDITLADGTVERTNCKWLECNLKQGALAVYDYGLIRVYGPGE